MNEKNWREWVFIFGMISAVLQVILNSLAMLLSAVILGSITHIVFGISIILFGIAISDFFTEPAENYGTYSAIALVILGILNLILGLVTYEVNPMAYILIGLIYFIVGIVALLLFSIAIFRTEEYPNLYAVLSLVIVVIHVIRFAMIIVGGMTGVYNIAVAIMLGYIGTIIYFILCYGAWKQLKL